jgi:hypothetical protein
MDANDDLRCEVQKYFHCQGRGDPADHPSTVAGCANPAWTKGCLDPMVDAFKSRFYQAGSAALAFAIIMLFGLVVIILLMQRIKAKADLLKYGPRSDIGATRRDGEINPDVEANF